MSAALCVLLRKNNYASTSHPGKKCVCVWGDISGFLHGDMDVTQSLVLREPSQTAALLLLSV